MHRIADTPDPWPTHKRSRRLPSNLVPRTHARSGHGTHAAFAQHSRGAAPPDSSLFFSVTWLFGSTPQSRPRLLRSLNVLRTRPENEHGRGPSRRWSQPIHPLSLDKERAIPRQARFRRMASIRCRTMVGGKQEYCAAAVSLERLNRRVPMNPTRVDARPIQHPLIGLITRLS